jgi:hypothetical protein
MLHRRAWWIAAIGVVACLAWTDLAAAGEASLHLEGKGTFSYLDACSQTSCPALLQATLSGVPFGETELKLPIAIGTVPDDFTGCRPVTGNGGRLTREGYAVTFSGEICDVPIKGLLAPPIFPTPVPAPSPQLKRFPGHSISGTIEMHVRGVTCFGQSLPAGVGTLTVYGGPVGSPWLFSIVGTADSIPLCPLPSP